MPPRSSPPNVYVPWTVFPGPTLDALGRGRVYPRTVYMDTPFRYGELLAALWARAADFTLIEHDIIPHPWAVADLAACPLPLCVFPYANTDRYAGWLGCTRVRAELPARFPGLVADVLGQTWNPLPAGHYIPLANFFFDALEGHGITPHLHLPPVGHLNPAQRIAVEWERGWCHWPARLSASEYTPRHGIP